MAFGFGVDFRERNVCVALCFDNGDSVFRRRFRQFDNRLYSVAIRRRVRERHHQRVALARWRFD